MEWSASDSDHDGCVPIVTTYACPEGTSHPSSSNYIVDLFTYLKLALKSEQGVLDLKSVLLKLPQALGTSMFSRTNRDIILHGLKQPLDYIPSA